MLEIKSGNSDMLDRIQDLENRWASKRNKNTI